MARAELARPSSVTAPEPAADGIVVLDGVAKHFGDVVALERLDLAIRQGEFFSLLGPSGCGKTTTLRLIGGFESPTEGVVLLDGRDVTDLPPYRRDVNTVFQSYGLFPHLNVFDNVAFGLRRRGVNGREVDQRVNEALELVSLRGYGKRRPAQMSGGQQQRVALARALVNRPRVLLLDEPLGALDLKLRKHMQLELKRIQKEVGITFVFVTHDQEEAMTISDRIAVMNAGHVEQLGAPEDVYESPSTTFVADFLGASNLLPCTVLNQEGGELKVALKETGAHMRVPAPREMPAGEVFVGVRPEKIGIARDGERIVDGDNQVAATLANVVFVGVSYQYVFRTNGERSITVFAPNSGSGPGLQPGDRATLHWRPEHTFLVGAHPREARADSNGEVVA